jgi:hypothetical protein
MLAVAELKAFNRLPIGSLERRDAVRVAWKEIVAEEAADRDQDIRAD